MGSFDLASWADLPFLDPLTHRPHPVHFILRPYFTSIIELPDSIAWQILDAYLAQLEANWDPTPLLRIEKQMLFTVLISRAVPPDRNRLEREGCGDGNSSEASTYESEGNLVAWVCQVAEDL